MCRIILFEQEGAASAFIFSVKLPLALLLLNCKLISLSQMSEKETLKGKVNEKGSGAVFAFCYSVEVEMSWGTGGGFIHAHLPPTPPRGCTKGSAAGKKREMPSVGHIAQKIGVQFQALPCSTQVTLVSPSFDFHT